MFSVHKDPQKLLKRLHAQTEHAMHITSPFSHMYTFVVYKEMIMVFDDIFFFFLQKQFETHRVVKWIVM